MTEYTKMVNGVSVPLNAKEIEEVKARETEFAAKAGERELNRILKIRQAEYGDIGEQLDMIFHEGIDAWKAHVQQVKDNNPKPTV